MAVLTSTDPVVVHAIDDMLRLIELVKTQRHRDPLRALQDMLLDMRAEVTRPTTPDARP